MEDLCGWAREAETIARAAGTMLREGLNEVREIARKTSANDIVTEMDRRVEAFIVGRLGEAFPGHLVRCEEGTAGAVETGAYRWHVDPLDGTINYLHRFPWFAVSMGLERLSDGKVVVGVINHVMSDEMYLAVRGEGAFCNGQRLEVSRVATLSDALVATGFPYWIHQRTGLILENVERFLTRCHGVRRAGAAALDLCGVAAGQYDGYWEDTLSSWDICAGALLVREAGGRLTDYDGNEVEIPTAHVVASNGRVHEEMVELVRGRYSVK